MLKKIIEWVDFKQFIRFGKFRIFVMIISNCVAIFFVDWLHIRYWMFAIFFIPANFFMNYLADRKAFKWKMVKDEKHLR